MQQVIQQQPKQQKLVQTGNNQAQSEGRRSKEEVVAIRGWGEEEEKPKEII